jgi:hypothetical protein
MNEIKAFAVGGCALLLVALVAVSCVSVGYVASVAVAETSDVMTTWTQESNATRRTGIEWDGRKYISDNEVRIAEIQADAQKKSSWAFTGFYTMRALIWGLGVVLMGISAWLFYKEKQQ